MNVLFIYWFMWQKWTGSHLSDEEWMVNRPHRFTKDKRVETCFKARSEHSVNISAFCRSPLGRSLSSVLAFFGRVAGCTISWPWSVQYVEKMFPSTVLAFHITNQTSLKLLGFSLMNILQAVAEKVGCINGNSICFAWFGIWPHF